MNPLQSVGMSIARHILTALAGVLAAKGMLDPSGQEAWIAAALGVVTVGWSYAEKLGMPALLGLYQRATGYARQAAVGGAVAGAALAGYGGSMLTAPAAPAHAWAHLAAVDVEDVRYAVALADQSVKASNSQTARDRLECYRELLGVVTTLQGVKTSVSGKPTFKPVLTMLEQQAALTDHAAGGSDLVSACAPVAEAHGMRVGQWLEAIAKAARR